MSKHTIYAWKAKYGGLDRNEAQRLKELEDENQRLKKLVANLASGEEYALFALNSARPTVIRKQFCI